MGILTAHQWNADFSARLMHNEGFRLKMYHDSMGIPTIGCGFNLNRPDWQDALRSIGVTRFDDFVNIKNGVMSLTVAQAQALLDYSDAPIIPQARAELDPTHFDNMCDARRCAFADLDFNIGQSGLDEFIGFRGLMNQACHFEQTGDPARAHLYFGRAADDLLGTGYAAQVGARAKRNAEMIRGSVYVDVAAFE